MEDYIRYANKVAFLKPIDGDILNKFDGVVRNGKFFVDFFIKADKKEKVFINGEKAEFTDGLFKATLPVIDGENVFKAEADGDIDEVHVYKTERTISKYRLSSDDNIIFLANINKNKDVYKSIFDDPYLSVYKKAHDLYGTKVHLNIYYSMPEHPDFSEKRNYFDLSMMTDKFKSEWEDNSEWLKLNFHAYADKPDKPYIASDYNSVRDDCERVIKEIKRFAGEKTLSEETTIHWGATTKEGVKAVRDSGIRVLAGYFKIEGANTVVSYHYPKSLVRYLESRDFWYDRRLGMYYAKIDNVLNLHTPKEIEGLMNVLFVDKQRSGFVEIMIHEEYFYKDYVAYLPDFAERVFTACRFLFEKGYKSSFLADVL